MSIARITQRPEFIDIGEYEYGRTLMPTLIDRIAHYDPDRPYAELAVEGGALSAYRTISMAQLANAIDKAAYWMSEQFEGASTKGYVAYAGPQDLRYLLFVVAGIKTNRTLFLPSLRNSLEANLTLFDTYQCTTMLMPAVPLMQDMFAEVTKRRQLMVVEAPDLGYFLSEERVPRFEWSTSFETGKFEPFVGLQTSGTTGIPKPVVMTHAMMTAMDAQRRLPSLGHDPIAFAQFQGKRVLSCFPFFHGAGLGLSMSTIIFPSTIIYPPPQPIHGKLVIDLINEKRIETAALPPWTIAEIAADPKGLRVLATLHHLYYGGGPLPTPTCKLVSPVTHLVAGFGTSEVGHYPVQMIDSEDAPYLKFSPLWGQQMRQRLDGLYELVIVRDTALEDYQSVFTTFPDIQEYATRDLFSQHPTKEGLWKFEGREDDIIVLSSGEKFNPTAIEDAVNGHPDVKSALVIGTGHFQSALLIEPVHYPTTTQANQELVERVWPLVEAENKRGVSSGRVLKHMILIGTPEKPFPRAGKGTVQRRYTVDLYAQEITTLYDMAYKPAAQDGFQKAVQRNERVQTTQEIESVILKAMQIACGVQMQSDDNFLDKGLDSLGVVTLLREVRRSWGNDPSCRLTARDIYEAKTVHALAEQLFTSDQAPKDKRDVMQQIYEQYISDLPLSAHLDRTEKDVQRKVVLLTGSTGTFGSNLLDRLLREESVAEIICVNRSGDAVRRQKKSMQEKGLCCEWVQKPVTFVKADMGKPHLSISHSEYSGLLEKVTHIVHNAWQVNFNVPVDQFGKNHVYGVRELINFSTRSKFNACLILISSISAISRQRSQPKSGGPGLQRIPERIIEDWSAAEHTGYSQSKLVSERVLATAAEKCKIPCAVYRLGQIAGPSVGKGCWPKQEWFPSVLLSSAYLGCLPSSLGQLSVIDWIPVDIMTDVVADWICDQQQAWAKNYGCLVRHGVNPSKIAWSQMLPHLKAKMGLPDVPLRKWLEQVAADNTASLDQNPALRLLDFFEALGDIYDRGGELDTILSTQASATLKNLQPVNMALVDTWLQQVGLI